MHEIYFTKDQYIGFWKSYLSAYAKQFYELPITKSNMGKMFEIAEGKNERYHYALYYMWSFDREIYEWYECNDKLDYIVQGKLRMITASCRSDGQDYMLLRLIRFLDMDYDILSYTGRNLELGHDAFPDEGSLVKVIRSAVKAMRRQGFKNGFSVEEMRRRV